MNAPRSSRGGGGTGTRARGRFGDPALAAEYRAIRQRIGRLRTSNYDISNVCNLRCEGCFFFAGEDHERHPDDRSASAWQAFFRREAERGINYAYLAGAEPALVPARILAAQDHIPLGSVFTNGTRRIPEEVRYRIHVSVWGNDDSAASYRGVDVNRKALANYAGDPRAVFVFTVNALNSGEILDVARACADNGVPLSFSYFSPTLDYNARLARGAGNDQAFFRISSPARNLRLDAAGFARARAAIAQAIAAFPETILYSMDYDAWVTQPGGIYRLDEAGVAIDCGNRLSRGHRHYNVDLTENQGKCCSPNFDCRDCRAYAMGYATYLTRRTDFASDAQALRRWLGVWRLWSRLFLPEAQEQPGTRSRVARRTPSRSAGPSAEASEVALVVSRD